MDLETGVGPVGPGILMVLYGAMEHTNQVPLEIQLSHCSNTRGYSSHTAAIPGIQLSHCSNTRETALTL